MQSLMRSLSPEQRAELQDTLDALLRDDRLQVGPRPARREPRPAAARRAGGAGPVQRRPAAGPRGGARPARPAPGARPAGGAARRRGRRRATSARSTARTSATCSARTPPATSTRSRTSPTAWSGPATSSATATGWSSRPRGNRRIGQKVLDELFARLHRDAFGGHRARAHRAVAASARRRPSRSSSATRSTSTCGAPCERAAARGERAGATRRRDRPSASARTTSRSIRTEQHDLGVDRAAHRHEPLDAAARLLPRREEGRDRPRHAHPDRSTRATTSRSSASPTTPASSGRRRWPSCAGTRYEYGTNLQHGLLLARRILARHRGPRTRRSSSSPTASRRPTSRTARSSSATRRRGARSARPCARSCAARRTGSRSTRSCSSGRRRSTDFVGYVTELNRGRAFYAEPEHLGEYVLVDFVQRRTERLS